MCMARVRWWWGRDWQVCPPLKVGRSALECAVEFLMVIETFSFSIVQYGSHCPCVVLGT